MAAICIAMMTTACGGAAKNEWQDLDYSKVYRAYEKQNGSYDDGYEYPNVVGCIDDDLYNCN